MQQARIAVAGATGRLGRHVVDVLNAAGHEAVPISRPAGVDVITGDGLAGALKDAHAIIDVTAGPSSEQRSATAFFTTAAKNLQQAGERAGVARYVVVSIIGIEKSAGANSPEVQAVERSLADLEAASSDLKERIVEEKKRNNMPIDSALGNPEAERRNADGRNDLPDIDDE